MDASQIAVAVTALLTPYLATAGQAAARKAGEAAWAKAQQIHLQIKAYFEEQADDYPSQVLTRFEQNPQRRQSTMEETLEEAVAADADFAQMLAELIQEADEAGAGAVFNVNISGGEVGEIINVDRLTGGLTINKAVKGS